MLACIGIQLATTRRQRDPTTLPHYSLAHLLFAAAEHDNSPLAPYQLHLVEQDVVDLLLAEMGIRALATAQSHCLNSVGCRKATNLANRDILHKGKVLDIVTLCRCDLLDDNNEHGDDHHASSRNGQSRGP